MGSLNCQIKCGDVEAIERWIFKRVAEMPEEAFVDFRAYLASPTISGLTRFISRWLDQDLQQRLHTTIRVARHRQERKRKNIPRRNLTISSEAYDRVELLAKRIGFRSVTAYVEHYAKYVW